MALLGEQCPGQSELQVAGRGMQIRIVDGTQGAANISTLMCGRRRPIGRAPEPMY